MTPLKTRPGSEPFERESGRWVRRGRTIVVLPHAHRSEQETTAGVEVAWIQRSLNQILGLSLATDGLLGPLTRAAIVDFQRRQGLTPDGIAGPLTVAALQAALAGSSPGGYPGTPSGPAPGSGGALDLRGANAGLAKYAQDAARFGLRVTSGLRPGAVTSSGNPSYHGAGHALDVAGSAADMLRFARYASATYGPMLEELIHSPLGADQIKNGQRYTYQDPALVAAHFNHVHIADVDPTPATPAGGGAVPPATTPAPASGNLPVAWSAGPVNPPPWRPTLRGQSSITCGPRTNGLAMIPDGLQPQSVATGWTPRTQAIADILRGPTFGWTNVGGAADGGRSGHVASSYHYCGRAIDAFPPGVAYAQPATGTGLSAGWRMANWAAHNAALLSISEVIFFDRIWTAARSAEGWRPYTHPGGSADPDTLAHRDHVHISVY